MPQSALVVYNHRVKSNAFRIALAGVLVAACLLTVSSAYRGDNSRAVAVAAGEHRVYEDELPAEAAGEITQLKLREYEIKVRAYQNLLVRRLLEAEAQKRKLSLEALLEAEGRMRATPPSEADLNSWFEEKKANYQEPLEKIKDKVRADVVSERQREGQRDYMREVWRAARVEVLLPMPRIAVARDAQRIRGNPQAPVMIVEFSDFQCSFCRRVLPTLMALLEKYPGQVAISYRDFPIVELHPMANVSAQAARCAGAQGKFWEYHDLLFAETKRPDRAMLDSFAARLQLDAKSFAVCVDSGAQKQPVEGDMQDGYRAGVSSTPAFFINGIYLSGAQPQSEFERIIERELKAPKKTSADH